MTETPIQQIIGGHPVDLIVGGQTLDNDLVGPITIRHGRSKPGQRCDPAAIGFAVYREAFDDLPKIGDSVTLDISTAMLDWLDVIPGLGIEERFRGRVSDLAHGGGPRPIISLVATSPRGRWNSLPAVDAGEHVASAGGVAAVIMADASLAPLGLDLGSFGLGGQKVTTKNPHNNNPWYECRTIADQMDLLAVSSLGELVENRDGSIDWQDITTRSADLARSVEFTAGEVLIDTACIKNLDGLANDVTLTYGTPGTAGQSSVSSTDGGTSIADYGRQHLTVTTIMADTVEAPGNQSATDYLAEYLNLHAVPRWLATTFAVELLRTNDDPISNWKAKVTALLGANVSTLIELTGSHGLPLDDSRLWLEGWTETITPTSWRMELNASDYDLTVHNPDLDDEVVDAPVYRSSSTTDVTGGGSATMPDGVIEGDRLVMFVFNDRSYESAGAVVNTPSGWTGLGHIAYRFAGIWAFTKVAGYSESSVPITVTYGSTSSTVAMVFRADPSNVMGKTTHSDGFEACRPGWLSSKTTKNLMLMMAVDQGSAIDLPDTTSDEFATSGLMSIRGAHYSDDGSQDYDPIATLGTFESWATFAVALEHRSTPVYTSAYSYTGTGVDNVIATGDASETIVTGLDTGHTLTPGELARITLDLSVSANHGGTHKYVKARVYDGDPTTGILLAEQLFEEFYSDLTTGNYYSWHPVITRKLVYDRVTVTLQSVGGTTSDVYSATRHLAVDQT